MTSLLRLGTFLLWFLLPLLLVAQPGNPPGGGDPIPISGIEILLAIGALFGIRKIFQENNKY